MTIYEYRCRRCFTTRDSQLRGNTLDEPCRTCDHPGPLKRVWSVGMVPPMHEHYNYAVGKPVSSMRQFRDELKRVSDERSEATGIPHNYEPIEYRDHVPAELEL